MIKLSTKELRDQHEELKGVMTALLKINCDKDIIHRLSYINKFLFDNMCRSMLEKDGNGNYINDENSK